MKSGKGSISKKGVGTLMAALLLVLLFVTGGMTVAWADDKMEAEQLVEKAKMTFESMVGDPNMRGLVDLLKKAKGVFISPQLLKGAFIFGASGGSGVLVVRDEKTGNWHGPAFYTIGGASFGFQIGGQASEVILTAMTERGVTAFLSTSAKLGADAGVAVGPVGAGASAATANLSADILSFSRAKGLYGGVSLDGAAVAVRGGWNDAYYGKMVNPADILIRHGASNPHARGLLDEVRKAAGQ